MRWDCSGGLTLHRNGLRRDCRYGLGLAHRYGIHSVRRNGHGGALFGNANKVRMIFVPIPHTCN